MKLILDIKDEKVEFIMELLKNFKFVKVKPLSSKNTRRVEGISEAVHEVNQHKSGKTQLKSARQVLDEL